MYGDLAAKTARHLYYKNSVSSLIYDSVDNHVSHAVFTALDKFQNWDTNEIYDGVEKHVFNVVDNLSLYVVNNFLVKK